MQSSFRSAAVERMDNHTSSLSIRDQSIACRISASPTREISAADDTDGDEDGIDDISVESDSTVESNESECQHFENVSTIIEQMFDGYQEFRHVRDVGSRFNHPVALPYTTAKSLTDVKLVVGWFFLPARDDCQPCRDEMEVVILKMLMWKLGCSLSKAEKFVRNHILWVDMTPFVLPWNAFQSNRRRSRIDERFHVGRYELTGKKNDHVKHCESLLSMTNDSVIAAYNKFFSPHNFPSFTVAMILGAQRQVDFFKNIPLFSRCMYPQDGLITHPQKYVNKFTTDEERTASLAQILPAIATAVNMPMPSPITVEEAKGYIFVSSVSTTKERITKGVETRALNSIFERNAIVGMKIEILDLAPLDDEVRERIDTMSHRELGLWIHHNGKRLKEEAAAAKKLVKEAKKLAEAAKKEDAITIAKAEAESRRLANSVVTFDDDAAIQMCSRKGKRERRA